ncbi:MAG: response regulator transcription factor, partial [Acidobacteriota bacterium]
MRERAAACSPAVKRRVLVVDDHPIIRQGLSLLIDREPDLTVCGHADDAHSAARAIAELRPDLVILDISLGGQDGLDLLKQVRLRDDELPILVLSMHDESIYAERVLRAGANGYIMKQEATGLVLTAVRRILDGQVYVPERIATRMLRQYARGASSGPISPLASLSDRELEVFRLIGAGRSTRQIAQSLQLSVKTVESYQAHLKEKLGLRNARELQHHAIEWVVK